MQLTQLEQDVLNGNASGKARTELKKAQAAEAKQAMSAQEQRSLQEQHLNELAGSELAAALQQITDECGALFDPIRNPIKPEMGSVRPQDYIQHLQYEAEEQAKKDNRAEVQAMITDVDARICELEAEKTRLAAQRQPGVDNPEIAGKVGLIIMDIETLHGARLKCEAELAALPAAGQHKDWGLDGWQQAIKAARVKALFSVIEGCEKVIYSALQGLKALNAVSLNYSRTTIRAS